MLPNLLCDLLTWSMCCALQCESQSFPSHRSSSRPCFVSLKNRIQLRKRQSPTEAEESFEITLTPNELVAMATGLILMGHFHAMACNGHVAG